MRLFVALIVFLYTFSNVFSYSGGSGTEQDPWQVSTLEDLQTLSNSPDDWDNHFVLMNDIDASETNTWNVGDHDNNYETPNVAMGFVPIGFDENNENAVFSGSFDGNGKIIDNLYINRPLIGGAGLFAMAGTPSNVVYTAIKDLGVVDCHIVGGNSAGALVAALGYSPDNTEIMTNCFSSGYVYANGFAGGLVSGNAGVINDCYSTCQVVSSTSGGGGGPGGGPQGIAGGLTAMNIGTINNSYSIGSVTGFITGGLVAMNDMGMGITGVANECYWDTETSGQQNSAGGEGKSTVLMKAQSTYSNWNTTNIWDIDANKNEGYPYLIAFNSVTVAIEPLDTDNDGSRNISELGHLLWISENEDSWGYEYELDNDIDAGETNTWNVGDHDGNPNTPDVPMGFNPIGDYENQNPSKGFTGVFDGQGFTISNLYINRKQESNVGFFGVVCDGAWIKNLNIEEAYIYGKNYVGTMVGNVYLHGNKTAVYIENCNTSSELLSIGSYVGGFYGQSRMSNEPAKILIKNCHHQNTGTHMKGVSYVGGFCGNNYSYKGEIRIINCSATTGISATGGSIGGFCGKNNSYYGSIEISGCHSLNDLSYELIAGKQNVGGFCGESSAKYSDSKVIISHSFSTCNALGSYNKQDANVGGFCGYLFCSQGEVAISDCYSRGLAENNYFYRGGFISKSYDNSSGQIKIERCFSTGEILPFNDHSGFCYYNYGNRTIFENCFWDNETSKANTSQGGTKKTTLEMKQEDTFTGWDFSETWELDPNKNDGYPSLREKSFDSDPNEPVDTDRDCSRNISTFANLRWISEHPECWGDYFELDNDIDAIESDLINIGDHDNDPETEEVPMGFSSIGNETTNFTGNFDGNNFTISNLYINRPITDHVGFLGVSVGIISNLTLDNFNISGKNYVGAVCGKNYTYDDKNAASIINCIITNSFVKGDQKVGGVIGDNNIYTETSKIENIIFKGIVLGFKELGGFCGTNSGIGTAVFNNCSFEGMIELKETGYLSANIGGFCGHSSGVANYESCTVKMETLLNLPDGANSVGGFFGTLRPGKSTSLINDCHTKIEILGKKQEDENAGTDNLGGFIGYLIASYGSKGPKIENCSSTCTIVGKDNIGGFIGYGSTSAYLEKCKAYVGSLDAHDNIGGFIGNAAASLNASYCSSVIKEKIIANDRVGGFIGNVNNKIGIYYSTSISKIEARNIVGGFIGYSAGSIVTNSIATSDIKAVNTVGGFIASSYVSAYRSNYGVSGIMGTTIRSSKAEGKIEATGSTIGGFIGYTFTSGRYFGSGSYPYSRIEKCASGMDVQGNSTAGGFIGNINSRHQANVWVEKCYSLGSLKGTSTVGGLVGYSYSYGGAIKITDCFTKTEIEGSSIVGGLIGKAQGISYNRTQVSNCYAANNIAGDDLKGLFNYAQYAYAYDSYWDVELSGVPESGGGEPRTTDEMTSSTMTYNNWDFETIWAMESGKNGGYPYLREAPEVNLEEEDYLVKIKIVELEPKTDSEKLVKKVELWTNDWGENEISADVIKHEEEFFATFTTENLSFMVEWGNEDLIDLYLYNDNGEVIGKIAFHYTANDYKNGLIKEAIVFLHDDLPTYKEHPIEKSSGDPEYGGNVGWTFPWKYKYVYENNNIILDGEPVRDDKSGDLFQVSMLIPPQNMLESEKTSFNIKNIRSNLKPLVFVHGVNGSNVEYWGNNDDYSTKSYPGQVQNSDFGLEFDVWEFYYPPDQAWDESGYLFGVAIKQLSAKYPEKKVSVVAHSMGGLVTRSYIEGIAKYWDEESSIGLFYDNEIDKVLFLATPQHGSLGGLKAYYNMFGLEQSSEHYIINKDADAPAIRELGVGSKSLMELNKKLSDKHGVNYLQISGTNHKELDVHDVLNESEFNDDNIVSLPSGNLLIKGVDLGVIREYGHADFRSPADINTKNLIPAIIKYFIKNGELNEVIKTELLTFYINSNNGTYELNPDILNRYYEEKDGIDSLRTDIGIPIIQFINFNKNEDWTPKNNCRFKIVDNPYALGEKALLYEADGRVEDNGNYFYYSANNYSTNEFKVKLFNEELVCSSAFYPLSNDTEHNGLGLNLNSDIENIENPDIYKMINGELTLLGQSSGTITNKRMTTTYSELTFSNELIQKLDGNPVLLKFHVKEFKDTKSVKYIRLIGQDNDFELLDRAFMAWIPEVEINDDGTIELSFEDILPVFENNGFGMIDEIVEIHLLNQYKGIIGKIGFSYRKEDFDVMRSKEAILFFHSDHLSYSNHPIEKDNIEWEFPRKTKNGESLDGNLAPVSMLIPPQNPYSLNPEFSIENIRSDKEVILFVHGVWGTNDDYWGNNSGDRIPIDVLAYNKTYELNSYEDYPFTSYPGRLQRMSDIKVNYDVWEFYYPPQDAWIESAYLLGDAINEMKNEEFYGSNLKVDIVAHSMGGLVARAYIEGKAIAYLDGYNNEPQGRAYNNDVNKVLFLATPQHGSFGGNRAYYHLISPDVTQHVIDDPYAPAVRDLAIGSNPIMLLNESYSKPNDIEYFQVSGANNLYLAAIHTYSESELMDFGISLFKIGLTIKTLAYQGFVALMKELAVGGAISELVVAPIKTQAMFAMAESYESDDNIVSLSSGNLFEKGIDLGVISNYNHSNFANPNSWSSYPYTHKLPNPSRIPKIISGFLINGNVDESLLSFKLKADDYTLSGLNHSDNQSDAYLDMDIHKCLPLLNIVEESSNTPWQPSDNCRFELIYDGGNYYLEYKYLNHSSSHQYFDEGNFFYYSQNAFPNNKDRDDNIMSIFHGFSNKKIADNHFNFGLGIGLDEFCCFRNELKDLEIFYVIDDDRFKLGQFDGSINFDVLRTSLNTLTLDTDEIENFNPNVTISFRNSKSEPISSANIEGYGGGLTIFGTTDENGLHKHKLRPDKYDVLISWNGQSYLREDVNIITTRNIHISTFEVTVSFWSILNPFDRNKKKKDRSNSSDYAPIGGGTVYCFYNDQWNYFGETDERGECSAELFPGNYKFKIEYDGEIHQLENIEVSSSNEVVFELNNVKVNLVNSDGNGLPGGIVEYYDKEWKYFGATDETGECIKNLLNGIYDFRIEFDNQTYQLENNDITIDNEFEFRTNNVCVLFKYLDGPGIVNIPVDYSGNNLDLSSTTDNNGYVCYELFSGTYGFKSFFKEEWLEKSGIFISNSDTITFEVPLILTSTSSPNGTIEPEGLAEVGWGSSYEYKLIPDEGYGIGEIFVDGISIDIEDTYTFTNIREDHSIHVEFIDNIPPTLLFNELTIELDNNGEATITLEDVDNGTYDISGIKSMSIDKTSFGCSDVGETKITFTATDNLGNTASAELTITVEDNIPPLLFVSVNPKELWPPNHKMETIIADYSVEDNCSNYKFELKSIVCNEPDQTKEKGDKPNDIQNADFGTADTEFDLRKERYGKKTDRIYSVSYNVVDAGGNIIEVTEDVTVPHSLGRSGEYNENDLNQFDQLLSVKEIYPNPTKGIVTINFELYQNLELEIYVLSSDGKIIRHLSNMNFKSGTQTLTWDGKNNLGTEVSSGTYNVVFKTISGLLTKQIVVIR